MKHNIMRRIKHWFRTRKDCRSCCLTCDYFETCAYLCEDSEREDLEEKTADVGGHAPVLAEYVKPCPFCGSGDVNLISVKYTGRSWISKEVQGHPLAVCCGSCGCSGAVFNALVLGEEEAQRCAINSWNTRVEDIIHSDGSSFAVSITD